MNQIGPPNDPANPTADKLQRVFGNYRAEWMRERVYSLYQPPTYFAGLTTHKPVILEGGRGTGKTTTLLAMSYEGRYAIGGARPASVSDWDYLACYLRMDSNRVGNFRGSNRPDEFWRPLFSHYLNLVMCLRLAELGLWLRQTTSPDEEMLTASHCGLISSALHTEGAESLDELREHIFEALVKFEANLQGHLRSEGGPLSMQGAPVSHLSEMMANCAALRGKALFFLIDEFENLQTYQQEVLNTLVKHSGPGYSIKIGMRPYGWKSRQTTTGEKLVAPADYSLIRIGKDDPSFNDFAERVCNDRLHALAQDGISISNSVKTLLPGLSGDEEFELLGGHSKASEIRSQVKNIAGPAGKLSDRELYVIYTFRRDDRHFDRELLEYIASPSKLEDKINNYGYAALFTIRQGRRGIRKYYCGWSTFLMLAEGNLRLLLWLLHESLTRQMAGTGDLTIPISQSVQTEAAQSIAERVLRELPDESQLAGQLVHLVLGLGRVFQVLAASPRGHLPEATQFSRKLVRRQEAQVRSILEEGLRHQALVEYPGTKLQPESLKESDYALHPVFSPFFLYSHRRKRKLVLSDSEILDLTTNPAGAIGILRRLKADPGTEMPPQLSLYEELFV